MPKQEEKYYPIIHNRQDNPLIVNAIPKQPRETAAIQSSDARSRRDEDDDSDGGRLMSKLSAERPMRQEVCQLSCLASCVIVIFEISFLAIIIWSFMHWLICENSH